MLYNFVIWGL